MSEDSIDNLITKYNQTWSKWNSARADAEMYQKELDVLEMEIISRIPAQILQTLKKGGST